MTRSDLPRVRPEQPWCWKLTPVYCACQEANTIYCTLVANPGSNHASSLFPVLYLSMPGFGVVSSMVPSGFYPQAPAVPRWKSEKSNFWLDKISGSRCQHLLFRIYAPSIRRVNAADWCSTVDCVEKKANVFPRTSRGKRSSSNHCTGPCIYLRKT